MFKWCEVQAVQSRWRTCGSGVEVIEWHVVSSNVSGNGLSYVSSNVSDVYKKSAKSKLYSDASGAYSDVSHVYDGVQRHV